MRIAHLARASYPFHPYGGLESHVYHLTLELARLGHEVSLIIQPPDNLLTVDDPAWVAHVQTIYQPYSRVKFLRRNSIPDRLVNYPLFSWRLGQLVRQMQPRPQIVHAHGLAGWGYADQPLPGVPLVLNPHGMEEFKNRTPTKQLAYAPFRALLRFTARRAATVIATDAALEPEVERNLGVPADRISLIPNAVALDELDGLTVGANLERLRANFGIGPTTFVLLSVGRLEANKGFDIMLEALSRAREELEQHHSDWRWLVVGAGSQGHVLQQETARLGLSDQVKWLGQLDGPTLHGMYELADLFVHPTLYEGSSLVTLEALAHRRPVLASRTGGLPDKVLESGPYCNGRLCQPGDPSALIAALLELVALDPAHRHQLGVAGRALVEAHFSWPAAARQTVALYERLTA